MGALGYGMVTAFLRKPSRIRGYLGHCDAAALSASGMVVVHEQAERSRYSYVCLVRFDDLVPGCMNAKTNWRQVPVVIPR